MPFQSFKQLPPRTRDLLVSTIPFSCSVPIINLFVNSFLWRQAGDIKAIVIYTICTFGCLPLGFYLSGYTLRRASYNKMYALGFIFEILAMFLLVGSQANFWTVFGLGILTGMAAGVYWSVRNVLTMRLTNPGNRDLFFGIETSIALGASVILPLVFGFLIERRFLFYDLISLQQSYLLLLVFGLLIAGVGVLKIFSSEFNLGPPGKVWLKNTNQTWGLVRLSLFIKGFADSALVILPAILTLKFIGKEMALGAVQSVCALVSAGLVLGVSKKLKTFKSRQIYLAIAAFLYFLAGLLVVAKLSAIESAIFIILQALCVTIFGNVTNVVIYGAIDRASPNGKFHFAYNCDRELFLNLGRIFILLPLVLPGSVIAEDDLIKIYILGVSASQISLIYLSGKIVNLLEPLKIAPMLPPGQLSP